MKVKYTRFHTVQPVQYEAVNFGGSIEVDLGKNSEDEDYAGATVKEARAMLDEDMDLLLAIAVRRAVRSDQLETSHIYEFYEE